MARAGAGAGVRQGLAKSSQGAAVAAVAAAGTGAGRQAGAALLRLSGPCGCAVAARPLLAASRPRRHRAARGGAVNWPPQRSHKGRSTAAGPAPRQRTHTLHTLTPSPQPQPTLYAAMFSARILPRCASTASLPTCSSRQGRSSGPGRGGGVGVGGGGLRGPHAACACCWLRCGPAGAWRSWAARAPAARALTPAARQPTAGRPARAAA
jgi:hypothetical protein